MTKACVARTAEYEAWLGSSALTKLPKSQRKARKLVIDMNTFVDQIVGDSWTGTLCDEDEICEPTVDDLDRMVQALDAKTRTLVSLYGQDGAYLSIGGGAGQYVTYVSAADDQLWNLLSENDDLENVILLNAGGQEGDFPARQVVDKPQALQAARTFFGTGTLDSALRWEKQI